MNEENSDKNEYKKIAKIFGLILLFFLFFWNALMTFFLIILLNAKTIKKSVFGNLPLEVKKGSYTDAITVEYKKEKLPLKLDVYYPSKEKSKFPVVFFAHGGGWITGSRKLSSVTAWAKFLASRGFAVVAIDYRYSYLNKYEELIEDYHDALNYIKDHSEELSLDKENIVLMGTSAGGTLSLYYAAYNSYYNHFEKMKGIKGVVAWYAPSDLLDLWSNQVDSLFAQFAVTTTMKGTPKTKFEEYKLYSPINYISERMVPTLLVHGEKDATVPVTTSIKLNQKIKECGVPSTLLIHPKGKHSFELELKDVLTQKFVEKTVSFIKKVCQNKETDDTLNRRAV
ncbi:peptidase S15 [Petrotoga sp. 9T1HF07.CasAA.8.2]|nr:peptidase S15 [Petrotoga sp. 8T1HF07.NaAc.6.1]PNR89435.1 peptidase S15 [Petrotoga sp. 9T1HF07.CasAA.8.2]PNR93040.1 peptidase S15 [Petrotoga sp. HWHPT.55.6.3]